MGRRSQLQVAKPVICIIIDGIRVCPIVVWIHSPGVRRQYVYRMRSIQVRIIGCYMLCQLNCG